MHVESQVSQMLFSWQDYSKNWLRALSIFFSLLLASSTALKQGLWEAPTLCACQYIKWKPLTLKTEPSTIVTAQKVLLISLCPFHAPLSVWYGLLHMPDTALQLCTDSRQCRPAHYIPEPVLSFLVAFSYGPPCSKNPSCQKTSAGEDLLTKLGGKKEKTLVWRGTGEAPVHSAPWLLGRLEVPLEPRNIDWKFMV